MRTIQVENKQEERARHLKNKSFVHWTDGTFYITQWEDGRSIELTKAEAASFARLVFSSFQYAKR